MTHTPSLNGVFPAVCVDVIHARHLVNHVPMPVVTLVFAVDAEGREGTLASVQLPMSLERGRLRPFLEGWRGVPFTDDELDAFDIDNCVGVGAIVRVQSHRNKRGHTVMQVQSVRRLAAADTPAPPADYIRYHHRQPVVA